MATNSPSLRASAWFRLPALACRRGLAPDWTVYDGAAQRFVHDGAGGSYDEAVPEAWARLVALPEQAPHAQATHDMHGLLRWLEARLLPGLQQARGLNLGLGWTGDERRWDLGVVGAGFEVPNLVGGWRQAFALRGQDASIELSRRVLTGGLLPYAGTVDPLSGRRWGGVTLSAATLRLAGEMAGWSSSASLRAGVLAGQNVAGNNTVQLRLASDRDWLDGPALRLNAGATLSLWHYRRNLSFHSFGQGGYYSPQRYVSLSLPVEAQGRQGAWSYRVRASVGRSLTFEADSPYYPTDPSLQAAAGQAVHAGGRGGGTSTSLRAEIERRLDSHWSVGATVFADRSAYYAPTQWLFYLRRNLTSQTGDVALPRPVQPYSQF
jgi:hypothetical protein